MAEHLKMIYPDTPDSRYVAQLVDEFLFPWEAGSVENPTTVEKDEGSSEPRTPVSHQDNHRRRRQDQLCAPLRPYKILSTQLLDIF